MDFSSINWFAVIACVVFSMVSGSLWFGPKTFFPVWWKAIGMKATEGPSGGNPIIWVLVVVASFVESVFVALMVNALGSLSGGATLVSGVTTGFLLWLGFVATTGLTNKLFAGQYKAWLLETGNHLINFLVFGAILGAWH